MSHPNLLRFHTWWVGRGWRAGRLDWPGCAVRVARAHCPLLPLQHSRSVCAAAAQHTLSASLCIPPLSPIRYETQNHLWVILEYCVGGDLLALLRSDGRLPEASGALWAGLGLGSSWLLGWPAPGWLLLRLGVLTRQSSMPTDACSAPPPPLLTPPSAVLRLGRDLACAVQALHSRGLLHCDLKPSNILLDGASRGRRLQAADAAAALLVG